METENTPVENGTGDVTEATPGIEEVMTVENPIDSLVCESCQ